MDGDYTLRCQSQTSCHARKRRQFKTSRLHLHLVRNLNGRLKKKRETSWQQLPRISPKMGQTQEEQQSRACKYLRAMVNQYESTIQAVHIAARTHTQKSKGTVGPAVDYRPQGEALPVISSDLTSELLHCLSTLPDPWPLAKITIDMEKPSQWVSKLCRLYFADEYAKRTVGLPSRRHVPDIAGRASSSPDHPPQTRSQND